MTLQRKWMTWTAVTAVLIFWFLALNSLVGDSPTMDEQNHIARGLAFLRTGDPRLSLEHPPLINSLSALPLLTMPEIKLPLDSASWQRQPPDVYWYIFAEQMMWDLNRDINMNGMVFLARLPIVFLTIGLALTGFHFARELWGLIAAGFAFLLLLFDPNLLAHGRYATTDIGGTLFVLLATYMLWRLWQRPLHSWSRWFAAAITMGLAFSSKLSTLVFVPIWIMLALLPLYAPADLDWRAAVRRVLALLSAGLGSILLVWLVFGLEWGQFLFQKPLLVGLNRFSGPMPTFWAGIEKIVLLSSSGRPGFLLGNFSDSGFLLYFPIAFLAKTPLITIGLFVLAVALLLFINASRRKAIFLSIPILFYFLVSMQSALNLGYRHLLPVLPFIYLLISGLAGRDVQAWLQQRFHVNARRLLIWTGTAVVALLLFTTLWIHPHYLSYFNVAVGGPQNGRNILLDSNIDWGQDLLRLQDWMDQNGVEEVNLAWFGTADPDYYGLNYKPLPGFPRPQFLSQWTRPPFNPADPEPGIYAISVSNLWEIQLADKNVYPWFRARQPDDSIGNSILIYKIP